MEETSYIIMRGNETIATFTDPVEAIFVCRTTQPVGSKVFKVEDNKMTLLSTIVGVYERRKRV